MSKTNQEHQKNLNISNLHLFLNMVRKSGHNLNITTSSKGVEYKIDGEFNNTAWLKTLEIGKEQGDISQLEAEIFENLMEGIYHIW